MKGLKILKLVSGSHRKAHSEMLILETGCIPLEYVITARRLLDIQTILHRQENAIITYDIR